jgi:transposase
MLVEAAWSYQYPARIARDKTRVLEALPKPIRDVAWKSQVRLCGRFQKMRMRNKKSTVIATAIARELAGFIWAIGQEVEAAQ